MAFLLQARLRMHSPCLGHHLVWDTALPVPPKALEISKAGEGHESPWTKEDKPDYKMEYIIHLHKQNIYVKKKD